MAGLVGQQLGNHRLIQLIGEGRFAEVYLGEHIHHQTQVAIKVLRANESERQELERFLQEARVLASLNHPRIVHVLDFGSQVRTPFLTLDYAAHGSFDQRYPQGTPLPLHAIISYVKQIADALQYMHDKGLIHRNIKPKALLLNQKGEVVLGSFGIVVRTDNVPEDIVGSPSYMAPEQAQGKAYFATDQYALGTLVYEWLCGTLPFHTTDPIEMVVQQVFQEPPSLRSKMPSIPSDVEQVVMIALAKDPQQRFKSVKAFANALEQAAQPI